MPRSHHQPLAQTIPKKRSNLFEIAADGERDNDKNQTTPLASSKQKQVLVSAVWPRGVAGKKIYFL
jgi:hypothetical protein